MTREKILDRVRKLLALSSNNPSQEEANAALLQAQRLMAEHQIEITDAIENEADAAIVVEVICDQGKRFETWRTSLAGVVARHFRCSTFTRKVRTSGRAYARAESSLIFVGLTADVEICQAVYTRALAFVDTCAESFLSMARDDHGGNLSRSKARTLTLTYRLGFAIGLDAALKAQSSREGWGLVLATPAPVVAYLDALKLNKGASSKAKIYDRSALNAGQAKGREFGAGEKRPDPGTRALTP